jgi:hypothetical protein
LLGGRRPRSHNVAIAAHRDHRGDIDTFRPIDEVAVPSGLYAVLDVRRGSEHRGRTPEAALEQLAAAGAGDRRVPGLWISGGAPKLGFCWAVNHHTWLGVASCGSSLRTA